MGYGCSETRGEENYNKCLDRAVGGKNCRGSATTTIKTNGPHTHYKGTCPAQTECRSGKKTGYQQYSTSSIDDNQPWGSSKCPEGSIYTKTNCQLVCGDGCKEICLNSCIKYDCSGYSQSPCNWVCGTNGCKRAC